MKRKKQYWSDRAWQLKSLQTDGVKKIPDNERGFANYSSAELNQLFKDLFGVKLTWCKALMDGFFERFSVEKKPSLLYRFADVYGYYLTLLTIHGVTIQKTKGVRSA